MTHSSLQVIREEHSALAAVLRSLQAMVATGPGDHPERFFDVLRAMLFYIAEFPEKLHHPKESNLLFPRVARAAPEIIETIRKLEFDHMQGETRVRDLQHHLLAWEFLGESRRAAFTEEVAKYVQFYLDHMRVEEQQVLAAAQKSLGDDDWAELDAAFARDRDPLAGGTRDARYDRLFTRIVMTAPAPIGLGPVLEDTHA